MGRGGTDKTIVRAELGREKHCIYYTVQGDGVVACPAINTCLADHGVVVEAVVARVGVLERRAPAFVRGSIVRRRQRDRARRTIVMHLLQ